jgi:hypothetical protein
MHASASWCFVRSVTFGVSVKGCPQPLVVPHVCHALAPLCQRQQPCVVLEVASASLEDWDCLLQRPLVMRPIHLRVRSTRFGSRRALGPGIALRAPSATVDWHMLRQRLTCCCMVLHAALLHMIYTCSMNGHLSASFNVVAWPVVLLLRAVDAACAPAGAAPLHDPLEGELPI